MIALPFPPVSTMLNAIKVGSFKVENLEEPIGKTAGFQTYCIAGANKIEPLIIPLKQYTSKSKFNSIEINYSPKWIKEHKNALQTAYGKSPFFEFYDYKLFSLYSQENTFLCDFNLKSIQWLLEMFQLNIDVEYSSSLPEENNQIIPSTYPQVFESKFGFRPNVSCLDLLFNQGPLSIDYLKQSI